MIHQGTWTRKFRKTKTRDAAVAAEQPALAYNFMVRTGVVIERHRGMSFAVPTPPPEEHDRTKEMIRWCRQQFGLGNERWNQRMLPEQRRQAREMCFLFTEYQDAMAFMLRWR